MVHELRFKNSMILGITVRRTNNTENFTLKFTYSDIAGIHKSSVPTLPLPPK